MTSRRTLHFLSNVFLMGSPGSGKTTIGRLLGPRLGMAVLDVDNDFLEKVWKMPVADKLAQVGADGFLEAEGEAILQLDVSNTIVSLSGSNPMHKEAMDHISSLGTKVFLDVQSKDILERLERMKVSRIVGQAESSMDSILQYRQQFYEGNYDIRVIAEAGEGIESFSDKIEKAVKRHQRKAGYVSTRGAHVNDDVKPTFNDVVLKGLAPDGGLYVPDIEFPQMTLKQLNRLVDLTYAERALRILEQWIHPDDLHPSLIQAMTEAAYSKQNFCHPEVIPVVQLQEDTFLTELFHGPTASFKDAALQLMPRFFQNAKNSSDTKDRYLILVATSGDTGGAVLDGFGKVGDEQGIQVLVLYPEDGISDIQKAQMTSASGRNVRVIGVRSDFDFCQSSIKAIFNSSEISEELFQKHGIILSAANSLNWGRLIPQVVYHVSSYLDLVKKGVVSLGEKVDLCVPTGNFGNVLAAFYAMKMGIPYGNMTFASNKNNILTDFLTTGIYDLRARKLHQTSSPAIDILKSSNLERLLYHLTGGDSDTVANLYKDLDRKGYFQVSDEIHQLLKRHFSADWCNEEQCSRTIKETFKETGYLLDPHTSVAVAVAKRFKTQDRPMLIASTAHHGKFANDVLQAIEYSPNSSELRGLFQELDGIAKKPAKHLDLITSVLQPRRHSIICEASIASIVKEIGDFVAKT